MRKIQKEEMQWQKEKEKINKSLIVTKSKERQVVMENQKLKENVEKKQAEFRSKSCIKSKGQLDSKDAKINQLRGQMNKSEITQPSKKELFRRTRNMLLPNIQERVEREYMIKLHQVKDTM